MKKVEDTIKNEGVCQSFCGACPSHPGTGEWLFCGRTRSAKKISRKGCFCPSCEVYANYDLKGSYFCDKEPST
jgi:hypothetical protein